MLKQKFSKTGINPNNIPRFFIGEKKNIKGKQKNSMPSAQMINGITDMNIYWNDIGPLLYFRFTIRKIFLYLNNQQGRLVKIQQ